MTALARGGVARTGFDAVWIVELGFGARQGFDFVGLFLLGESVLVATAAGGLEVDDCGWSAAVEGGVEMLLFELVEIRAWVGGFVFEHLHEAVEAGGEEGAEDGTEPVDLGGFVG